jgi:BlaI family transcriptional regulator, penicillinase repressor
MATPNTDDPFKKLSRREREILEIIHRRHEASVTQIIEDMESPPTRAAVRALMGIMERKSYVRHTKVGREFVYHPCVDRDTSAKNLFRNMIDNFFGGSLKKALASHLAEADAEYSEDDLRELTEIISRAKKSH